ncbi:apolipoproteiN n-acyltransferase Lnt/dolichol-phosphate-mannosyl transferase Dpm1 [Kutzneria sp. 744]|nr:apolipoproteiN n-acyltransferase Lnt/dolichol-phosphate-mannosyl transferase Dpm1 [Kutzneria sp. 744]
MAAPVVTSESDIPLALPTRRRRAVPVLIRMAAALAGGGIFYASYPPRPLWYLAPLAFALLAFALRHRTARGGFLYGLLFGMAFVMPLLEWLQSFLGREFGPFPWVGLSFVVSLYMALAGAAMAVVSKLRGGPVWMAAVFLGSEVLRTYFPFDGFPWGKVGFGQPEGLFLPLAAIGGTMLLGFAVVVTGTGLTELIVRWRAGDRRRALVLPVILAILPVVAGAASWSLVGTDAQAGTRTVAIIQGNAPDDGINLMYDTPILRRNHLAATEKLAADIKAGRVAKPDIVVWPEVATDLRARPPLRHRAVPGHPRRRRAVPHRRPAHPEPHHHPERGAGVGPEHRAGPALRQAEAGAVRRVHPAARHLRRGHPVRRRHPGHDPRRRARRPGRRQHHRRRRHLLRGRLRPGGRRRGAGWCDNARHPHQQRVVRAWRDELPAAGHVPGRGGGVRPRRRGLGDQRGERPRPTRRDGHPAE